MWGSEEVWGKVLESVWDECGKVRCGVMKMRGDVGEGKGKRGGCKKVGGGVGECMR